MSLIFKRTFVYTYIFLQLIISVLVSGQDGSIPPMSSDIQNDLSTNTGAPTAVPVLEPDKAENTNNEALEYYQNIVKNDFMLENIFFVPSVVPVLTQKEAEKANKDAIQYRNKELLKYKTVRFFHKIGVNKNRICFLLTFIPFFFLLNYTKRKQNQKTSQFFSLQRRLYILLSVSLLSFGLLVFVPWSVYFGNCGQFPFIFQDFANQNLVSLTLSIIALFVILLLIPPVISNYLVSTIAGLGLAVYLQAMFMNCYLGAMDGTEPEWNHHLVWGITNAFIWCSAILIPSLLVVFIPSHAKKAIIFATGLVLSLEIIATISLVASAPDQVWKRYNRYFCSGANQFQLSKEKNIVVFIFDQLGSGLVNPCFEADPQSKEAMKDFTWYSDSLTCYGMTYPSILSIITGTYIHSARNQEDLFKQTWSSPSVISFFDEIKKAGFDSRLYLQSKDILGPQELYKDYFSNIAIKDVDYIINFKELQQCIVKISGFSSAPFLLKKYFFYPDDFHKDVVQISIINDKMGSSSIPPERNDSYYRKMISSNISTDSIYPVLAFHYTRGAHVSWDVDERCQRLSTPSESILPPARSCFYLISEFIRLLKENNIYDQTAIIICSDHSARVPTYTVSPHDMTLMIKYFNSNNNQVELKDNKALAIDILPSILHLIDNNKDDYSSFDGLPIQNIPPARKRLVYHRRNHPLLPQFIGIDGNPMLYNCEAEFLVEENDTRTFLRYMPWNVEANADDIRLKDYNSISK